MSETMIPDLLSGNIIKTRIRLARNLNGYPFKVEDQSVSHDIVKRVNRALLKCDTFDLFFMKNLSDLRLEAMKERYVISNALIENREFGSALINKDESVSVMVHEEDVIREQCFMKGLRLFEAYKKISYIDDEINKNLDVAYSERLGYLTACPTNLGTGLRASVLLFLPALTESGRIKKVNEEISLMGLTMRGLYGEGTKAEGCMYQLSNEVTLGLSEYEILKRVEETVIEICNAERRETERIYLKNELITMDRAKKSFGVLTNAVLLSYNEFLQRIAEVKLGTMLGMIDVTDISKIDDLIVSCRPYNVMEHYGKEMSATDRDLYRAELVGKKLLKLKG